MTDLLPRTVIEPANPKLNVSRNASLPHSPGIRVGNYIFLSGMGPVDPVTGGRNLGPIAEQIRQTLRSLGDEGDGDRADGLARLDAAIAELAAVRETAPALAAEFEARWPAAFT